MFIEGARRRMITCNGIVVVVSQFLGEYFHPLTLCFKGHGGRGRRRGIK